MSIEAIGILAFGIGIISLFTGPIFSIYAIIIGTLLGAAAATILTALGGVSVPPVQLVIMFAVIGVLLSSSQSTIALQAFRYPTRGFWLAITVIYGLLSAFFLPRLFLGQTNVFAINRTGSIAGTIALVPLAPVSGNLTQPVYFALDAVCFALFYAYASSRETLEIIAKAIIVSAFVNIVFGVIDFVTYRTGTTFLLAPIRNGNYSLLSGAELAGFKRIVGSFAEAGYYGYASLWFLAFAGKLCLRGIDFRVTFIAAIGSLGAVIASTSTAAYVALGCLIVLEYAIILVRLVGGKARLGEGVFVVGFPVFMALLLISLALNESVWSTVQDVYQVVFLNKASSDSGVERSAWNQQAILNILETSGFGVGVGSTRASSWIISVPASLGVFGTITYLVFVGLVLAPRTVGDPYIEGVQSASRSACFAVLIFACASGGLDLGLLFAITAALTAIPLTKIAASPITGGSLALQQSAR